MPWRLRIWCDDCSFGQDPQGCFDGGESESDEVFATKAEAEWFGLRTISGPWNCKPIECDAAPNATEEVRGTIAPSDSD